MSEENEVKMEKGYYRASLMGCAGSPEIIVYFDGKNYYSFDSANPSEPLDEDDFIIDAVPLFPSSPTEVLKNTLWKAREHIIETANEYKREKSLSINNSLEGGKVVSEIEEALKVVD